MNWSWVCVCVCGWVSLQSFNKQQHPSDAGGPVHQTHQEAELHTGEGGLDGSLHQQGQSGKVDNPTTPKRGAESEKTRA